MISLMLADLNRSSEAAIDSIEKNHSSEANALAMPFVQNSDAERSKSVIAFDQVSTCGNNDDIYEDRINLRFAWGIRASSKR